MAGKLWKYLPKPTSFSIPTGNAKATASFSGPTVSIIPKEARRKKKSDAEAFDAQEPTSPKVSCIGQVKHKKSNDKKKSKSTKKKTPMAISQSLNGREEGKMKKKPSAIQGMFGWKVRPGRAAAEEEEVPVEEVAVAPVEGRMRKYMSGREMLGDFDWRTVVAAEEEEEEEEVMMSHSGPILLGGGVVAREVEKRKEVNLWKRRTRAAPEPLRVN